MKNKTVNLFSGKITTTSDKEAKPFTEVIGDSKAINLAIEQKEMTKRLNEGKS